MEGEGAHTPVPGECVEVDGEQHVRGLGLPVRLPLVVALAPVDVVPADPREVVAARGHGDDPGAAGLDGRPEPVDEGEVTEVVGGELGLPAGADAGLRAGHDPGAVDDEVDGPSRGEEPVGEGAHALQVAEVEVVRLDAVETGEVLAGGVRTARRHDDPGPGPGQRPGGLQAEAGVPAGDDGQLPGQVDAPQDLVGGARGPEARADLVLCGVAHVQHATDWSALEVKQRGPGARDRGKPRPDGGITVGAACAWARTAVASRRNAPQGFSRTIVPVGKR